MAYGRGGSLRGSQRILRHSFFWAARLRNGGGGGADGGRFGAVAAAAACCEGTLAAAHEGAGRGASGVREPVSAAEEGRTP